MAKKQENPINYSKPLKRMQYETFCQKYAILGNATQAAIKAKYSKRTATKKGSQLLTIVDIKRRVEYLKDKAAEKAGITVQDVIEMIKDTHKRAKSDGDEYAAELKAEDMLAKHVGAYEKDNEQSKALSVTDIAALMAGK